MPKQKTVPPRLIYQMKVTLEGIRPAIWRRFQVDGNITLSRLHMVLQAVMGWYNCHLHSFTIGGREFGEPEAELDLLNESKFRVSQVLEKGVTFTYLYDFGDSWEHRIKVEKVLAPEPGVRYPRCLAGERHCPPEDCGSVPGFYDFLEAIAKPSHPEHESMLEWAGGSFDPEHFSVEQVNRMLGARS